MRGRNQIPTEPACAGSDHWHCAVFKVHRGAPPGSPRGSVPRPPLHRPDPQPSGFIPRKEVIQPQLPLRLPCYDFTPITGPTFDGSLLAVRPPASGVARFRGVTGGVYKARERIHRGIADPRLLATPPSWRRVSASNPNRGALYGICSTSRYCCPLYAPMYHVGSPGHKGHDDLTSSPPSSGLSPAVPSECPPKRAGN